MAVYSFLIEVLQQSFRHAGSVYFIIFHKFSVSVETFESGWLWWSTDLANKFEIGRTQVTDLIKNKDTVLKLWKPNGNDEIKTIKCCKIKSINNINDLMYKWFCKLFGFFYAHYIAVIWKYCTSINDHLCRMVTSK